MLLSIVVIGQAMVPGRYDVMGCLKARVRCYNNFTCGDLLDDLDDYCDLSGGYFIHYTIYVIILSICESMWI